MEFSEVYKFRTHTPVGYFLVSLKRRQKFLCSKMFRFVIFLCLKFLYESHILHRIETFNEKLIRAVKYTNGFVF